jgi:hypothetical protein
VKDERLDELGEGERALALRLRAMLRESETTDVGTAARLAAARARALDAPRPTVPRWLWAPGGLTAAAILAALVVQSGLPGRQPGDARELAAAEALEVLTDEVDADFYEDLDLYRWLAEEDGRA